MKKLLMGVAIAAAFGLSSPAFAFGDVNNASSSNAAAVGQGGAGGNGGAGGVGIGGTGGTGIGVGGTGIGEGGDATSGVYGSGNSHNTNRNVNRNRNSNRNAQGQQQGQLQGQQQGIAHSGNSRQSQGIAASGNSSQGQSTANANNSQQAVNINTPAPYIPVSTAYAAPLTSGVDTCMGSSSGGVQAPGFGISLGSTWRDSNCVMLKNAKALFGFGERTAALALMCQNSDVAAAMQAAGQTCPGDKVRVAYAPAFAPATTSKVEPVAHPSPMHVATQASSAVTAPNGLNYRYDHDSGSWVLVK